MGVVLLVGNMNTYVTGIPVWALLGLWLSCICCHTTKSNLIVATPVSYEEAKKLCTPGQLVCLETQDQGKYLETLNTNTGNFKWTSWQLQWYKYMTWLNGSAFDDRELEGGVPRCGNFNPFNEGIYEKHCLELHHFLCQVQNCRLCPKKMTSCFTYNSFCYIVKNISVTWYEARNRCTLWNGDLAILSQDDIKDLAYKLWPKHGQSDTSYWIGVRNVDWVSYANYSCNNNKIYHWLKGQPKYDKDCVVLGKQQGKIGWLSYSCKEKAQAVCHQDTSTMPGDLTLTTHQEFGGSKEYGTMLATDVKKLQQKDKEPEQKWKIILPTVLSLTFVAAGTVIIVLKCLRHYGYKILRHY